MKKSRKIRKFLREKLSESGLEGFVVGVSGGVDSAVTSMLCAMASSSTKPTYALSMPIGTYSDGDKRAVEQLKELKDRHPDAVHTNQVDLTSINGMFESMMEGENIDSDFAKVNMRSRIRMTALYAYANYHDLMVVGTGNKVEDKGVGFFTKYGDGGVDVAPIADLYKSEVYDLAEHLLIPSSIQEAEPTDGLWDDDRTDEEQLGMTYDEIEKFMKWEEDPNINPVMQIDDEDTLEKYKEYRRRHESTRHKMKTPPVCEFGDDDDCDCCH